MAEALGRSPRRLGAGPASTRSPGRRGAENDALALALDPLGPLDLLYRPVRQVVEVDDADPAEVADPVDPAEVADPADGSDPGAVIAAAEPADPPAVVDDAGDGDRPTGPPSSTAPATRPPPAGHARPHRSPGRTAASFEARLVAAGVDALPVDVWLDGAGRVRRLVVSLDEAGAMTATFTVGDVGGAVEIVLPDPGRRHHGRPARTPSDGG